ncbi:mitochondrial antiviral-signaling protein [Poeciliopsis prolifica]|uniref:mitochondrial antiviral-signaling protein n=1 Tax=Poeciliopsis prolifica TaxID=188132 RepID=UPI002413E075|nr:mitochondrial antiviral-signaling protein [Poeciliopsis prolifica]
MSFASDKLYNGYLRQNMPVIVSKVKVREIVPFLPCLTAHDREIIEAKRETSGNFNAMVLLLECLKRRENWPEQFIQALQACEHTTLAADIQNEYDTLLKAHNPSSGLAAATVVRAHVHPAPAASQLPVSESVADVQPVPVADVQPVPVADVQPAPPEPASQASAPVHTPAQQQVPQMAFDSPPEPISEPPAQDEFPRLPSTPPPSPEIQHAVEGNHAPYQEPEENSESDIQDPSGDTGAGRKEAVVVPNSPQQQQHQDPVPQSGADHLQTAAATKPSLSSTSFSSDVSDRSSVVTLTPEKHPVQDTTPPALKVPLQPQMSAEHTAAQVVKSRPQTEASSSPEPFANKRDGFHQDANDNSVCLSKPGQLVSIQPVNPPLQPQSSSLQPYSGDTGRLELSDPSPNTRLPSCTAQVEKPDSAEPHQENGIVPDHSEPEENHYESPNQSFDVAENVVHVAEMPSILNCDGQAPEPELQIVNGEPAKGSFSPSENPADDTASSFHSLHSENNAPIESTPLSNSEKTTPSDPSNGQSVTRKHILIGAGVGACILLMAMKFKR